MIAMRYAIALPRDYDMTTIRTRIETRGSALDDFDGLLFKAYCMTEIGVDGATANSYAPFYVWANTSRMGHFLWGGGGFQGIERDFGRPTIDVWPVTSLQVNRDKMLEATHATFGVTAARPGATLDEIAADHKGQTSRAVAGRSTAASVRGIDGATGADMAFNLLTARPRATPHTLYEVGHVSAPGLT